LLAGLRREHHSQRVARLFRPRLDVGIIIALRPKQLGKEIRIGARASAYLGRIRGVLAFCLERGLLAEIPHQLLKIAERAEAFDLERVTDVPSAGRDDAPGFGLRRNHRRRRRCDVLRVQFRPRDAKVRQWRQRGAGIQFGSIRLLVRLRGRLGCSLGEEHRRLKRRRGRCAQQPRGTDP
jgi:hypothetical protein